MNAQITNPTSAEIFGEPIYSYTRAQALEDGELIDVTETAREVGFRYPTAVSAAVWADCVAWSDADTNATGWPQDQGARLWDVLYMARFGIKRAAARNANRVRFSLLRVPRDAADSRPREVALIAHVGPGDDAAPVITIGFPSDF
jgi:hypothetical protein